jgi:predicted phosphodiesterase
MKYSLLFFITFSILVVNAQDLVHRVYLIGDAGKDTIPGTALVRLKNDLYSDPISSVVFLGDNVYFQGLEIKENTSAYKASEKKLLSQLKILDNYKGNVIFIPGNHDWRAGRCGGVKAVEKQAEYINNYLKTTSVKNKDEANFIPSPGYPGPSSVMLAEDIRLIALDTQWWLQDLLFQKTLKNGNKKQTSSKAMSDLDSLLALSATMNQKVIVAAHHPVFTSGSHGRKWTVIRALVNYTPFQVFGLMGMNRLLSQDIYQPRYKKLNKEFLQVMDKYQNVVIASGHDHNLQYYRYKGNRYIVSGSGSKLSGIRKNSTGNECLFQEDKNTGYFVLTYYSNGSVKITAVHGPEAQLLVDSVE